MLRQVIMCRADTGLYPLYWTEGREIAEPEVALPKKCVDFGEVMAWAKDHEIGEQNINHFDPGTDVVWPVGQAPAVKQGHSMY
jgi:hypothetical protein